MSNKANNQVSRWYIELLAGRAREECWDKDEYERAYRSALTVRHLGRRPTKVFVPKLGNTGRNRG